MGQTMPLPITAAMLATANAANEQKPRYGAAGATDWAGGLKGDDQDNATALVSLANDSGGAASAADYSPRHQAQRATQTNFGSIGGDGTVYQSGTTIVVDVARPRGWIAPSQPYQGNGTNPAAPVVSSLSPATIAAGTQPLVVTI